jgi:hypothetical protein
MEVVMEITDLDQTTLTLPDEVDEVAVRNFLGTQIDGRNAFWLTRSVDLDQARLSEPSMSILTKGNIAYVWYVGSAENAGFVAIADGADADTYDDDVFEDFDISHYEGDRVTVRSKFVLPIVTAIELGCHFMRSQEMSDKVRWFEL